ncbi:MAG: corrinoid protein [Anaerolineaceae bacterium]|nr:MAG: corrinoid protein [Anaerolineaceae bacterium]
MSRRKEILTGLYENTLWGKAPTVVELTNEGLGLGMTPSELLWEALIPALEEVGRRFEIGEFFVPEMLIAARAMQGAMDILKPLMIETGIETVGTFLMLTVKGDMHDIGKNLCDIMLEGAGFKVIDLGVNVAPATVVEEVAEHEPELVGFSAFLTTTMPMFKVNLQALEEAGLRDQVKVLVGGAPVTPEYAEKAGADGFAKDASEIVRVSKQLLGDETDAVVADDLSAAVNAVEDLARKAAAD